MRRPALELIVKEWVQYKTGVELKEQTLINIVSDFTQPKEDKTRSKATEKVRGEWISVTDKMPEHNEYFIGNNIILKTVSGEEIKGFACKNTFYKYNGDILSCVTHWKYRN